MPTTRHLKSTDSLFLALPPSPHLFVISKDPRPPLRQIDTALAPMGVT